MGLEVKDQMKGLIEKSSHILIACTQDYSADTLASALALSNFLQKSNKKHDIVCSHKEFGPKFSFLPRLSAIKSELEGNNKFLVTLNISEVKVKEFSYDVKGDELNIYITPESGKFTAADVVSKAADYPYDLVITLDTKNLNALGKLFEDHTDFFYSAPIINIDDSPDNEHFGQVNHIDVSAGSVTEILFDYIKEEKENFIDKEMATLLLTGIFSKTRGFRHEIVSPKTLQIASELMKKEADSALIVKSLYQSKSIDVLKIWGKILSRLQAITDKHIYYSYIDAPDLKNIQINSSEIVDVIDELLVSIPDAGVIVVSYKKSGDGVRHIIWGNKHHNSLKVVQTLNPKGTRDLAYVDSSLNDVRQSQHKVLEVIKGNLS